MNSISEAKKAFMKKIGEYEQTVKMLDELGEMPSGVHASVLTLCPVTIEVSSMQELHNVRKWLRRRLKTWEDRLESIWYSQGKVMASYKGLHHPVSIWLATQPEDFPQNLQSEKCRVVELEPITERNYAYVCEPDIEA